MAVCFFPVPEQNRFKQRKLVISMQGYQYLV